MDKLALRKDLLLRTNSGHAVLLDGAGHESPPLARADIELVRRLDGSLSLAEAVRAVEQAGLTISMGRAHQLTEQLVSLGFLVGAAAWSGREARGQRGASPVLRAAPAAFSAAPPVPTSSGIVGRGTLRAVEPEVEDDRTELDPRAGAFSSSMFPEPVAASVHEEEEEPVTRLDPRGMVSRPSHPPPRPSHQRAVAGVAGQPPDSTLPTGPLPRLRPDLIIRERARGDKRAYEMIDPRTRRMLALYAAEMSIARELDGNRNLFALAEVAHGRGIGVTPAKLWKFISVLEKSGFLEQPQDLALDRNEFSVMAPLPLEPDDERVSSPGSSALARVDYGEMAPSPVPEEPVAHPPIDALGEKLASLQISRDAVTEPRRSALRLPLIALGLVGVALAAYLFAYPWLRARLLTTKVSTTQITMASPVESSVELRSPGYVVPQSISKVSAKVTGRVLQVLVKEGAMVRVGDRLVELDPSDVRGQIATANARVLAASARAGAARSSLHELETQLTRERALVAQQVRPRAGLDDLEGRVQSQRQAIRAAAADVVAVRTEVENLRISMSELTVTAPIDGMVITKPAEVGELVGPDQREILEIADPRSLLVETDVPEGRLSMVRPGTPAEIVLDAFSERRFRGVAAEIGQRVDRAKATVTVRVRFTDPLDGVMPDMAARVSFLTANAPVDSIHLPENPVVPADAVADRAGRKVVFVVTGNRVQEAPVTLGERLASGFVLVQGPPVGTRLVANPPPDLRDGQEVELRTD